jgi:hypothetical protein
MDVAIKKACLFADLAQNMELPDSIQLKRNAVESDSLPGSKAAVGV